MMMIILNTMFSRVLMTMKKVGKPQIHGKINMLSKETLDTLDHCTIIAVINATKCVLRE